MLATLLSITVLLVCWAPAWSAHPAPAADEFTPAARLDILDIAPVAMKAGDPLSVQVRVRAGDKPLPASSKLELRLQRPVLSTRYAVGQWGSQSGSTGAGSVLTTGSLPRDLPAGKSVVVRLTADAARVGLEEGPFGPRGLAVVLRDSTAHRLAVSHGFTVWAQDPPPPVNVAVLIPLGAGTPDAATGQADLDRLSADTAPRGRLTEVLAACRRPGVSLAIDPLVLTPAAGRQPLPANPDAAPTPGAEGIAAWQRTARVVAAERDSIVVPAGNADAMAAVNTGHPDLLGQAHALAAGTATHWPRSTLRVAWPAGGLLDEATAHVLAGQGVSVVVLPQAAYPADRPPPVTPNALAELPWSRPNGLPMRAVMADAALSDALSVVGLAHAGGSQDAEQQDRSAAGAVARSRLAAETAAIAAENPGRVRHVVATAGWDWQPGEFGRATVAELTAQPWTRPSQLSEVLSSEPSPTARHLAPLSQLSGEPLPADGITTLLTAGNSANRVAAAWQEPELLLAGVRARQRGLLSSFWRADVASWRTEVARFRRDARGLGGLVSVVPGSKVTQVSHNVELPVRIRNNGPSAVTVRVRATPRSSRLQVTQQDRGVRIPANGTQVTSIPVRGLGSGDTSVRVRLLGPDGTQLGPASEIDVAVRADWETWGTAAVGGLAALVLVVGVVRTIRRQPTRAESMRQAGTWRAGS